LEYVYVQKGCAVVDFSIGHFQMKPSFVERIEGFLIKDEQLKKRFGHLLISTSYTISKQRKIRLERLQELSWQLDYLCCFYVLTKERFESVLSSLNTQHKLEFLATAYNTGFYKSLAAIEIAMHQASYPYGSKYPQEQQYKYAAVAWDYYQRQ